MNDVSERMREVAKDLLKDGTVTYVLGWEKNGFWWQSPPFFAQTPEDAEHLVWDPFCVSNLAKYAVDLTKFEGKVGVFVKGCDSRGVNLLARDRQIDRERIIAVGVPCAGLIDPEKIAGMVTEVGAEPVSAERRDSTFVFQGPGLEEVVQAEDVLFDKCKTCSHRTPVGCDQMLGEEHAIAPEAPHSREARFQQVAEIESMTPDERYEFWTRQLSRCIRCYACRNICPACSCRKCVFDVDSPDWLPMATGLSEKLGYHVIRALHVAGRCVECGECERACPMNIPIRRINDKIVKDMNELFGEFEAGTDKNEALPLGSYSQGDPEEFM